MDNYEITNIFNYATSELSQDAIICWLLKWSDDKSRDANGNENKILQKIGREFLLSLLKVCIDDAYYTTDVENIMKYNSIEIYKQYKYIDILVELKNCNTVIVIEDKTITHQHSNQLARYKEAIDQLEKYKNYKKKYIYFKTEDFIPSVELESWKLYTRNNLMHFLNKVHVKFSMENSYKYSILYDYYLYIKKIDKEANSYKIKNIENWNERACRRFNYILSKIITKNKETNINDLKAKYVSNKNGGSEIIWFKEIEIYKNIYSHIHIDTNWIKDEIRKSTCKLSFKITHSFVNKIIEDLNYVNINKEESIKRIENNMKEMNFTESDIKQLSDKIMSYKNKIRIDKVVIEYFYSNIYPKIEIIKSELLEYIKKQNNDLFNLQECNRKGKVMSIAIISNDIREDFDEISQGTNVFKNAFKNIKKAIKILEDAIENYKKTKD